MVVACGGTRSPPGLDVVHAAQHIGGPGGVVVDQGLGVDVVEAAVGVIGMGTGKQPEQFVTLGDKQSQFRIDRRVTGIGSALRWVRHRHHLRDAGVTGAVVAQRLVDQGPVVVGGVD